MPSLAKAFFEAKQTTLPREAKSVSFPVSMVHQGGYMIDRVVTVVDILSKPLNRQSCPRKRQIWNKTPERSSTRLRS